MTTPRLLGDRYELGETLGYGGMAEVHRGRDTRLGRDVAIKVLRQDLARDNGFQARFEREAQNSASLNHPAIVSVYDTGEEEASDGTRLPYIVMEYVEGRTLRDILAEGGRLLPLRALEIVADVCAALEFSHRNGIIHRDIKPGNVMLTPTGEVKVMDFGIARAVTQAAATMTQTSAVMGTAQYLSPEQARGESVDARSDIYSAGCLLYELLVGHPPFTGDSPVSVAYQHVREDPVPPSELDPDVTPTMDAVVCKALAKNPANRYQSAAEMRADLLRAATGRTVEATPLLPTSERTRAINRVAAAESTELLREQEPRRRRRVWPWLLLVLALIAIGIGATFATMALVGPKSADVPSVIGQPQAAATNLLENRGFHVAVKKVHGADKDKGKVTGQKPKAGSSLTIGHAVTIIVDQGVARIAVPDVRGLPLHQAEAKLKAAGLKWKFRTVDNRATAGTVVDSQPSQGTLAPMNSPVTLLVANGTVPVPSVIGMSRSSAISKLDSVGLHADTAFVQTDAASPGVVFAQNPSGGRVQPGSTVTISVAVAPPPPPSPSPTPPSATPTPTPTPTGGPSPTPTPSASPSPSPSASGGGEGGGGGNGNGGGGGGNGGGGGGNGNGNGNGGGNGGGNGH